MLERSSSVKSKDVSETVAPEGTAEVVAFDASWDENTVQAAFDESVKLEAISYEWADAIDRKAITIFTLATAIASVAPRLFQFAGDFNQRADWFIGLGCFSGLVAAICCFASYKPNDFAVSPNPLAVRDKSWMELSPSSYRWNRMRELGNAVEKNRKQCNLKAYWLSCAIGATIVEVGFLFLAYLAAARL